MKTKALRDRKLCQGQNVIRDTNPDFRINPDPDVCRIGPKMSWIHVLVDMSHFAKYRKMGG